MDKAGNCLGRVVRRLDSPEAALAWLVAAWPTIVGKTLAAHTRPLRCSSGSLEVVADAKPWQKQLEDMKASFSARINQSWGRRLVREITFVGTKPGPNRIPRELDNDYTPFVRRRKT